MVDRYRKNRQRRITCHKNGSRRDAKQKGCQQTRQNGYKQRAFRVYPVGLFDKNNLPNVALVYRGGGGEPRHYRLDFLSPSELKSFWHSTYVEKENFLNFECNCHHRRPRCQKGLTILSNLSYVDKYSHDCYNKLISAVARWSKTPLKRVTTKKIEEFLRKIYRQLKWLMSYSDTEKVRSLESTLNQRNIGHNLNERLISNIAKWSDVETRALHVMDVCKFFEYMYPVLIRLAIDYESGKLKTLVEFFRVLNKIWLPIDEQIKLGRH